MPIYEYSCPRCGAAREIMHKMSETPEVACTECPDGILQRQVSAAAFRLKGGGWYETDFKKDNQRNLVSDSPPEKAGDKASDKPADSGGKPADKAASAAKPAASASPAPAPTPTRPPSADR